MELDAFKAILKRLSNKHKVDYETGKALHGVLAKLRAGTEAEQKLAEVLVESLTWTGSEELREFVLSVHAAVNTKEGRRAAGLPAKKRGKEYDARLFDVGTPQFGVLFAYHQGELKQKDAVAQLATLVAINLDRRTFLRIYNDRKTACEKQASSLKSGN